MDDDEYDDDEPTDEMDVRWEAVSGDFLKFDRIPADQRLSSAPDICAFIYLDRKFPDNRELGMISSAEQDEIWLRIYSEQVEQLTDDEILYLTRCGVRYDEGSLAMFI